MNTLHIFQSLGPLDVQNIRRDAMLRWMVFLPFVIALAMRGVVPLLLNQVEILLPFEVAPYYPSIMGTALVMIIPSLCGMVIGFLLLDQRDDGTLQALQVTPLSLNGYLVYRLALPVALSLLMTMVVFPLASLVSIRPFSLFLVAIVAAPLAPLSTLFLATFASNKVQGLALTKLTSVFMLPALAAYFVPMPWQLLFGLTPTYWVARALWQAQAGETSIGLTLVLGVVYQVWLVWVLLRRFNRVMG